MRVIKNEDTIQVQCPYCKSILAADKNDLHYHYHFGHHSYFYYNCGACGKPVTVNRNKLPKHWQVYLETVLQEVMGEDYYDY